MQSNLTLGLEQRNAKSNIVYWLLASVKGSILFPSICLPTNKYLIPVNCYDIGSNRLIRLYVRELAKNPHSTSWRKLTTIRHPILVVSYNFPRPLFRLESKSRISRSRPISGSGNSLPKLWPLRPWPISSCTNLEFVLNYKLKAWNDSVAPQLWILADGLKVLD